MFKCKSKARYRNVSPAYQLGIIVIACLTLSACSTVESQSFKVSKTGNVDSAYIAVGADFSKYDRLQAEDMGIFFPTNSSMSAADQQRLRQSFRDAFLTELESYEISRDPGPTTMKVQASLIDLRNASGADLPAMRRDLRDVAAPGSLVFLMEIRDSESDQVLARAADRAKSPRLATAKGTETDWQAVDEAAQHWAALFRNFLDQNLSR